MASLSGYLYDFRKYSEVLALNGFSNLTDCLNQEWNGFGLAEYRRFLKAAIAQGSFPMLAVAGIIASISPHIYAMIYIRLSKRIKNRLNSLIQIGECLSDIGHHINHLWPNLDSIKKFRPDYPNLFPVL